MPPKKSNGPKVAAGHHEPSVPKPKAETEHKEAPYTGWDGEVPSKDGGDQEDDFMVRSRPPFSPQAVRKTRTEQAAV